MRLLVLGGTVFLSKTVAAEGVRRGHQVTCAARGASGDVPEGAALVRWDRAQPPPVELTAGEWDAVVDVSRTPSHVRRAVAAFPHAHWVFVSTVNVYAGEASQGPGLREPITDDVDLAADPDAYGGMKVACERLVRDGARSAAIVRPGLIAGPGDPSGRFTYWARRLADADADDVLAPGAPDDVTQLIDVRDLAAWLVTLAETHRRGEYDAVGRPTPIGDLLRACGPAASYVWVDQDFLAAQGVEPWMGPESVPLWLRRPEYDAMVSRDVQPAVDAGLALRPVEETCRAIRAWLAARPDAPVTGITREREAALLAAWRAR